MARPIKEGFDYWSFYCDFYENPKVIAVVLEFGQLGMAALPKLFNEIFRRKSYYLEWGENACLVFSHGSGGVIRPNEISEVVKGCLRCGIFDQRAYDVFRILTSKGIQEQYVTMCNSSNRIAKIEPEYDLTGVNSLESGVSSEVTRVSSEETGVLSEFSTQRKGKEKKGKERKGGGAARGSPEIFFETQCRYPPEMLELLDEIVRAWNVIPHVSKFEAIQTPEMVLLDFSRRLAEFGPDGIRKAVAAMAESEFWRTVANSPPGFDQFLGEKIFLGCLNGKYKNGFVSREKTKNPKQRGYL